MSHLRLISAKNKISIHHTAQPIHIFNKYGPGTIKGAWETRVNRVYILADGVRQ